MDSKRTQLNALKSNSTKNFYRFKSYCRPEYVKTLWVTLYLEQGRRWDYSWDKNLSVLFVLDEILYCGKDVVFDVPVVSA